MIVVEDVVRRQVVALQAQLGRVVVAVVDVGGVAVDQVLFVVAIVATGAEGHIAVQGIGAAQLYHLHLIVHGLRVGEHRLGVLRQHLDRRRADRGDVVVRRRHRQVQGQLVVLIGQVAVGLAQGGRRLVAETVVVQAADRRVDAEVTVFGAEFGIAVHIAERAAADLGVHALEGQAILHPQRDRAAERVQAEHGVVALHRERLQGEGRDEVPVDVVAEGFVQPHPVLIDGDALRHARDRRGLEAVIDEVRLELAALFVGQADVGQLGADQARQGVGLAVAGEGGHVHRLDLAGDLVGVDGGAGQGRVGDHGDGLDGGVRGGSALLRQRRLGQARGQ